MDCRISGGGYNRYTKQLGGRSPPPTKNRCTGICLVTLHGQPIWREETRRRSDEPDENEAENNIKDNGNINVVPNYSTPTIKKLTS